MSNPAQFSGVDLSRDSAVEFLLNGEILTSTDGLVALAKEILSPMLESQCLATRHSYAGLRILGDNVVEQVYAALKPGAPVELAEAARSGILGFLTLLEDREEDDHSEVYAATILLRVARAQFEAHMVERSAVTPAQVHTILTDAAGAFQAGVDLAIEMMREGEAHWGTDRAELIAENREGKPQTSFALPYLQRAIAEPTLLAGFSAVLSTLVGVGDKLDSAYVEKHAAGAYAPSGLGHPADGVCLSPRAIADIDAHILRTTGLIELFLSGGGDSDADLVYIIEFAKSGFEKAKAVMVFDDAYYRILESESVLKAAMALAEDSKGTSQIAVALLGDLLDETGALSSKFDGGVHDVERKQSLSRAATARSQKEAVAA